MTLFIKKGRLMPILWFPIPCQSFAFVVLVLVFLSQNVAASEPIPITTRQLKELGVFPVYSAPATVISINDAQVSTEISGILTEILVRVGEHVNKNDIIAKLDCRDHINEAEQVSALLQAAQAESRFARFQLERAQALVATKAVSAELLNERQTQAEKTAAEVNRLSAALKKAERRVQRCEIRAPFKAVVIDRIASVGEFMNPGTLVLRLLDREHLEVSGSIQEQDLKQLHAAQSIRFVAGESIYPLKVRTVIPFVESKIRSYEVRFSFVGTKAAPGEVGRVEWTSANRHLPAELLVRRGDQLGVFIENAGHAKFQPIPGALEGQPAQLPLSDNTAIIIDGRFMLADGDPVRVIHSP